MSRRRCIGIGCVLWLGLCLAVPAWAQGGPAGEVGTTASLPIDNEAMLIARQVHEATRQGDYRLAIELCDSLRSFGGELVADVSGERFLPAWRMARRLLHELPTAGRELYRQMFDAEVSARFERAKAAHDVDALRALYETRPLSSHSQAIGMELATVLLDRGRYGDAVGVLEGLRVGQVDADPAYVLLRAVALGASGKQETALGLLETMLPGSERADGRPWDERREAIAGWLRETRDASFSGTSGPFNPQLSSAGMWSQPLLSVSNSVGRLTDGDLARALDLAERLPLHKALLAGDWLYVRARGTIWGLDALTLAARWRVGTLLGPTAAERESLERRMLGIREEDDREAFAIPEDVAQLVGQPLMHSLGSAFGLVLSIEAVPRVEFSVADQRAIARGAVGSDELALYTNQLVARSGDTGRIVWRLGADIAKPLFGVEFQAVPVAAGARLLVPFRRGDELHLASIDAEEGSVGATVQVVGPPTHFVRRGGRCSVVTDGESVFVGTGNGVVASFDADTLAWQWAATYPSTLAERNPTNPWQPAPAPRELGQDPPRLIGDLLVVSAADADEIIAYDTFDGRIRWRRARGPYTTLLGVSSAGVLLGGPTIMCVDPRDGETIRWRSVPVVRTGSVVEAAGVIYASTGEGVIGLDAESGRVVSWGGGASDTSGDRVWNVQRLAHGDGAAGVVSDLVVGPASLLAVSPNRIVRFPDVDRMRRLCASRMEAEPGDGGAVFARAWLAVLGGEVAEAAALLGSIEIADASLADVRDRLLMQVHLARAHGAADVREAVGALRAAVGLARVPEVNARLHAYIGVLLEQQQEWDTALEHYLALLREEATGLLASEEEPGLARASWWEAVGRIGEIVAALETDTARQYLETWIQEAAEEGNARALRRLLAVDVELASLREVVRRSLAALTQPFELAIRHLPEQGALAEEADPGRHVALLLHRWETHVALGMLSEARADAEQWRVLVDDDDLGAHTTGEEVETRVRRIETSQRKLEQLAGRPFDAQLYRQWLLDEAELILDPRSGQVGEDAWVLARRLDEHRVVLLNTVVGRPWRETPDGVEGEVPGTWQDPLLEVGAAWLGRPVGQTWACVTDGALSAVPVRGGLICVGRGPERGAGQRIWERSFDRWPVLVSDFGDLAVGGELGVYVVTRSRRVVLLGWDDGRPRWERSFDLPGITRLTLAGSRLVIEDADRNLYSVDARDGSDLQTLGPDWRSPWMTWVIGDAAVVLTEEALVGLSVVDFGVVWERSGGSIEASAVEPEKQWLAIQQRRGSVWEVLEARTGEPVFSEPLDDWGRVSALAVEGDLLWVAAFTMREFEERVEADVHLALLDATTGVQQWVQTLRTLHPIDRRALLANPDFVPVLLHTRRMTQGEFPDDNSYGLQLVRKDGGALTLPLDITGDFRGRMRSGEVLLHATRSRLIVQAQGALAGYGSADAGGSR